MVKTKQQKSKPKKTPHVKKQGKQANIVQFRAQLDALGLKIIQVTADGNCFFRGLADQLEGNEEEHGKYRSMVVQYIMSCVYRTLVKCLNPLSRMMSHLMNIAN